jgi:hypothetical protein
MSLRIVIASATGIRGFRLFSTHFVDTVSSPNPIHQKRPSFLQRIAVVASFGMSGSCIDCEVTINVLIHSQLDVKDFLLIVNTISFL